MGKMGDGDWIPAYAGMTEGAAGLRVRRRGGFETRPRVVAGRGRGGSRTAPTGCALSVILRSAPFLSF